MDIIIIFLFFAILVQIVLILKDKNVVEKQEHIGRINELIGYIDKKMFNAIDVEDRNVLMIASMSTYFNQPGDPTYADVIKYAVQSGMDVNKPSRTGDYRGLNYALKADRASENVRVLLEVGADVNLPDRNGRTALFDAVLASKDEYEMVVNVVKNIDYVNNKGETPLMCAARNMKVYAINDLLDRGADPKFRNVKGMNSYEIAEDNRYKHRVKVHDSHTDEGTHHDSSNTDIKRAAKRNHEIGETIRMLKCLVEDKPYKYKKH